MLSPTRRHGPIDDCTPAALCVRDARMYVWIDVRANDRGTRGRDSAAGVI